MRESAVELYLTRRVQGAGGIIRKLKWIATANAPDRFISFPHIGPWLAEVKRPGEKPRPAQTREHNRLRAAGVKVITISTKEQVDLFIDNLHIAAIFPAPKRPTTAQNYEPQPEDTRGQGFDLLA